MLPSLVAHAVGYKTVISAHNNVYVQMHVAGFTVFTWYNKCRRLQYYKANVSTHNTVWVLTRLEGCIVPILHGLVAPSYRCAGYGKVRSSVLWLT